MADFRQLALEYVLADEEAKLTSIAQQAARELQTAAADTNPVARWVESVQPWMPAAGGDVEDGQEMPDWTARAKALEFLSRTLENLGRDVLKSSQVKLLVGFFGAMFDVDHKAGVMASATALSKITAMKSFQPSSGLDIIQKVCTLKDDFARQVAKTRLEVYKLVQALVSDKLVASNLKRKEDATFVSDLVQLCRSERDPDCLMVWFDILRVFMTEYNPSKETLEDLYGAFKAYFPITLPRTAQSTITPEELKAQLRSCFCCNQDLAPNTIPFLVGKLDQGDGVTVNVKVDVLRTLRGCLEQYEDPQQAVVPYANRIWGSLKYEVRNGEIEDTIWATLEALKALTTRLTGDDLRDYTLNVTRDCVNDLSTPMYCGAAGRLMLSVLSASPAAFVLMVAPAITHIKENLRHPKSTTHSEELLKLLRVVLETRLLLMEHTIKTEDLGDFVAIDAVFKTLYDDVFKTALTNGRKADASQEAIQIASEAVQGAAVLACQRSASAPEDATEKPRLLADSTCADIHDALFDIAIQHSKSNVSQQAGSDQLVNDSATALQRVVQSTPFSFAPLVQKGTAVIRSNWQDISAPDVIQGLGPLLAYVGCSELPSTPSQGLAQFLSLTCALVGELNAAIDAKSSPEVWCAIAASIQSASRYFNDACLKTELDKQKLSAPRNWTEVISTQYPELNSLGGTSQTAEVNMTDANEVKTIDEVYTDFILITLFVVRQLYQKATMNRSDGEFKWISLSTDFSQDEQPFESQYLQLIADLAGFVIHELNESQQLIVKAEGWAVSLFQDEFAGTPSWNWLLQNRVNVLSFGIVEALYPASVARLFEARIGQQLAIDGLSVSSNTTSTTSAITSSILSTLANKHKIETDAPVMEANGTTLSQSINTAGSDSVEAASRVFAVASGLLRRYSGKETQNLMELIKSAPKTQSIGSTLARRLEIIVAPQRFLTKESFAVVKPLWMQKVYFQLVRPMLEEAIGTAQDLATKTNYGVAVLMLVKHMSFSVYEDDADKILRVAIAVSQTADLGPDTLAALDVLKTVLTESADKAQDHVRSIINICTNSVSSRGNAGNADAESVARCGKLALQILGGLPRLVESRFLLSHVPQVERQLAVACGHRVRDVRASARVARVAWAEVK